MKIEIGESLLLSWLRHVKECQLVQTNWKASSKWELRDIEKLEVLMVESERHFKSKYNYNIFKGTSNVRQLISQAEIDVMGINFDGEENHLYAIDVAFHTNGLQYGGKVETVERVIKKYIRTAMCVYGYYGIKEASLIFASPKIHNSKVDLLNDCLGDVNQVLRTIDLNYEIRLIANEDFNEKVLEPVLKTIGDVADTSELFIRSLQMYNLFAENKPKRISTQKPVKVANQKLEIIDSKDLSGLDEMKIGTIVRYVLRSMLENGEVSKEEVELMQTKRYSKETFDLQYPLLIKEEDITDELWARYYSTPVEIRSKQYYICSQWFEVPSNNDRLYLMKWLARNTIMNN